MITQRHDDEGMMTKMNVIKIQVMILIRMLKLKNNTGGDDDVSIKITTSGDHYKA